MKAKTFVASAGKDEQRNPVFRVGFTVGVQTFYLNMGSDGLRPLDEAEWWERQLKNALSNITAPKKKNLKS